MRKRILSALVCLLLLCGCAAGDGAGETGSIPASAEETAVQAAAPSETAPASVDYDYAALYLQVLEDLWSEDHGLNSGAFYISVDLSEAPGDLTAEEILDIAETFAKAHQAEPLTLSYRELQEQGYLSGDGDHWEDGVLFSIDGKDLTGPPLPEGHFSATKWRASEGAYFFEDCTAAWSDSGAFLSYQVGAEAIS